MVVALVGVEGKAEEGASRRSPSTYAVCLESKFIVAGEKQNLKKELTILQQWRCQFLKNRAFRKVHPDRNISHVICTVAIRLTGRVGRLWS
jgi:hypothetical protein